MSDLREHLNRENVERILGSLISRDFKLNRHVDEEQYQQMTMAQRNVLAYHVLLVSADIPSWVMWLLPWRKPFH